MTRLAGSRLTATPLESRPSRNGFQPRGRFRAGLDGEERTVPMCIVRQGVAGLLQDFIGVAGIVLRHHADVGGHHMAPEFQRQVDDPLGLFSIFARVLIRAVNP